MAALITCILWFAKYMFVFQLLCQVVPIICYTFSSFCVVTGANEAKIDFL